jgi:hypothetical protein
VTAAAASGYQHAAHCTVGPNAHPTNGQALEQPAEHQHDYLEARRPGGVLAAH